MFIKLVSIAVAFLVAMDASEGKSNDSYEHQLRAMILDNYDRVVRPETKGNSRTPINIEFGLKLNKLSNVNIKQETITVDTWIIMKWRNTFVSWNKEKFGKVDKISFEPTEIWFPDIALINNADGSVLRAGGPKFFTSLVTVSNNGDNVWNGPATFTASCSMALSSWPFDEQTCNLTFGSITYGDHLLKIKKFVTKAHKGDNFEDSGNWIIDPKVSIAVTTASFGNCCPFNFSQITYTIGMGRRFEYHVFYMVAPCAALALLTLVSFWIPSDSGERIGFITTLLLGMMVFLLIVPDSLPESSEAIPILGLIMMSTMVIIGVALLATIFVLRCFFAKGTPPRCLQCLVRPSKKRKTAPSEMADSPKTSQTDVKLKVVNGNPNGSSDEPIPNQSSGEDDNRWASVSESFDKIFFWLFFIVIVLLYGCAIGITMSN